MKNIEDLKTNALAVKDLLIKLKNVLSCTWCQIKKKLLIYIIENVFLKLENIK